MTWEQKFAALCSIADTSLKMRKPGDWYVSANGREISINNGYFLSGEYGEGKSPQEAIENDFKKLAENQPRVVLHAFSGTNRREVFWNGFMWQDL